MLNTNLLFLFYQFQFNRIGRYDFMFSSAGGTNKNVSDTRNFFFNWNRCFALLAIWHKFGLMDYALIIIEDKFKSKKRKVLIIFTRNYIYYFGKCKNLSPIAFFKLSIAFCSSSAFVFLSFISIIMFFVIPIIQIIEII